MWSISMKQAVMAGAVALALGAASIGLAVAQTQPPQPTQPPGERVRAGHLAFIEALARRLGVTVERLQQAISEARQEVGIPDRAERRRGERPGPGERSGRVGDVFRAGLDVAAGAIGITQEQLRQELPGKSLAQVAQAHGKNPTDVANALKTAANQRVDQAIATGRLTADRAVQMKQRIANGIDQLMNRVAPERAPHERTRGERSSGRLEVSPSSNEGAPARPAVLRT